MPAWLPALAALLCACVGGDAPDLSAESAAGPDAVPVDSVSLEDIRALVDAVGADQLFERIAGPSPYLTDLFGVQPTADLVPTQVLEDLVPDHATVVDRTPEALILDLVAGPRVTFRFGTDLVFEGNPIDRAYARIEIRDSAGYPAEPVAFRTALEEAGVADRYLPPNPYFAAEQAVLARMQEAASIEPVQPVTDTAGFGAVSHAVIIVGETHGGTGPWETARTLLESVSVEWIGIEMLGEDLQAELDRYLESAERDAGPARSALLEYYDATWNTRGHEVTEDPADNPYFRLIETARSHGKRVFALDAAADYILFRFGEFPLGAAVRDFVWASNVPAFGRGVVYGGSSHFLPERRPNMLTFLREKYPDIPVFSIEAGS